MYIWNKEKNERLKMERSVSFDEVESILLFHTYIDSIENPARSDQMLYIISLRGYTYVIPYIVKDNGDTVLKTIYPSRKFHKIYSWWYEKNYFDKRRAGD